VIEALADAFREAGLRLDDDDLERLFEAGLIPGGDEVAALEYVARYADADYDHVVLDTAPTGHTLRLLDLPAVLAETLGVAGDVRRRVGRTARAARSVVLGPAAYWGRDRGDDDAVTALRERVTAVGDLLRDPGRSRFRVVLTPERLAISETGRLVDRLREAEVPVDALAVNRLFTNPTDCDCERCRRDAERHAANLATIEATFDLPIRRVPEFDAEGAAADGDVLAAVGARLVDG
jgi:arsenite-transporting ATPase